MARLAGGAAVPRGPAYYVVLGAGPGRHGRRDDARGPHCPPRAAGGDRWHPWRRLTRAARTGDRTGRRRPRRAVRPVQPGARRERPPGRAGSTPSPRERYHLVVIGAGTAGLVTASIAAGLGARVALVERHLMGGDCLNVGCVPSKGIISAARSWQTAAESRRALRRPGRERAGRLRRRRWRACAGSAPASAASTARRASATWASTSSSARAASSGPTP